MAAGLQKPLLMSDRKGVDLDGRRGREDLGDVLIEGATVGLPRNLALEEFLGIH